MAGKIQNQDIKSEAELVTAGATASYLPNDDKVYVTANAINKTLKDALEDGDIGAGLPSTQYSSSFLLNHAIAASVGSSALTIALKGADGNDPSANNPVEIVFRHATLATGTPVRVSKTAATSLVISSGSTLGHASAIPYYIYVYAINNAGTIELAASSKLFEEGTVLTTTAEGGAGAADSSTVIYSTTARSNVAVRLLARMKSTQATAGTWAAVPTEISLPPFSIIPLITEWEAWTPTGSWSTNTTYTGKMRRIGDTMFVKIKISLAGAPTSAQLTANLPAGYTIDTTKINSAAVEESVGYGLIWDNNVSRTYPLWARYNSTTSIDIRAAGADEGYLYNSIVNQANPITFATGDNISINAEFPIAEWSLAGGRV